MYIKVDSLALGQSYEFTHTSMALGQSHDCPSASEVTLTYMGKIDYKQSTMKQNKTQTVCIILGMYWIWQRLVTT